MNLGTSCEFIFQDTCKNRKTLFERAITCSKYGKVVYIRKEELNELPPLSQDVSSVDRNYIKMISFLYTPNLASLIEGIASLPSWQNVPRTIILDDISEYCSGDKLQNACGIIALLLNIANSCSKICNRPCKIYISSNNGVFSTEQCNTLKELYSKTHFANEAFHNLNRTNK